MLRTSRVLSTCFGGLLVHAVVAGCGSSRPTVPALGSFNAGRCAVQRPVTLHQVLWPAARRELAPPAPVAIQLCRYSAEVGRPVLRLMSSRRLTAHEAVAFFAGELAALPRQHGGVVCPDDDGSQVVATLRYPKSRGLAVSVGLRGCEIATNGTVSRTASGFGTPPQKASPLVVSLSASLAAPIPGPLGGERSRLVPRPPLWCSSGRRPAEGRSVPPEPRGR
jgi:hypothetical protein